MLVALSIAWRIAAPSSDRSPRDPQSPETPKAALGRLFHVYFMKERGALPWLEDQLSWQEILSFITPGVLLLEENGFARERYESLLLLL